MRYQVMWVSYNTAMVGTRVWSRSTKNPWMLQESELTPTGANLLDGRYAVFGYVVDGADLLQECQAGDLIEYIKVTDGGQYLQQPVPHPKSSSGTI